MLQHRSVSWVTRTALVDSTTPILLLYVFFSCLIFCLFFYFFQSRGTRARASTMMTTTSTWEGTRNGSSRRRRRRRSGGVLVQRQRGFRDLPPHLGRLSRSRRSRTSIARSTLRYFSHCCLCQRRCT